MSEEERSNGRIEYRNGCGLTLRVASESTARRLVTGNNVIERGGMQVFYRRFVRKRIRNGNAPCIFSTNALHGAAPSENTAQATELAS